MSLGYPNDYIAWKLGVNRNTVSTWKAKAGVGRFTVRRLIQRIKLLSSDQRDKVIAALQEVQP